jgi:hypothetical protein
VVAPCANGGEGQWRAVRPSREPIPRRERLLNPWDGRHPVARLLACAYVPLSLLSGTALTRIVWQFGTRTPKGDITITTRVQGVTVGAAPFFLGTAILHVLSNAIRVLDPGTSRNSPLR